jgi:hypothetical protein
MVFGDTGHLILAPVPEPRHAAMPRRGKKSESTTEASRRQVAAETLGTTGGRAFPPRPPLPTPQTDENL